MLSLDSPRQLYIHVHIDVNSHLGYDVLTKISDLTKWLSGHRQI